jgi:hypothetical protein
MNMVQLLVKDIISSTVAISNTAGLKAFDTVQKYVSSGQEVILSFAGIENLTSAFCNAVVGKLYMQFGEKHIDSLVKFADVDNEVWQEKIRTAKILGVDEKFRNADQENLSQLFA